MKTIYLFRHSAPDRQSTAANSQIPLTADGKAAAKRFWNKIRPSEAVAVYSSPYRRAYETAEAISKSIITDARLAERETGEQGTFTIQAWARQYTDCDFANTGGESFRTVRTRMTAAISDILTQTKDGTAAAVVSHAAAICAYLQQYCTTTVTDADKKLRRITFSGATVLDGPISTPSCFVLRFEDGVLKEIKYIGI